MSARQGFQPAQPVEVDEEDEIKDISGTFYDVDVPPPLDVRAHRKTARLSSAAGNLYAQDRLVQVKTKRKGAGAHSIAVNTGLLDEVERQSALLDVAYPGKRNRNRAPFKDRVRALSMLYGPNNTPSCLLEDIFNDQARTEYYTHKVHEPLGNFY